MKSELLKNTVSRFMFVFSILFYATTVWGQGTNHSQVMANLLSRDECFKAMDYMKLYKDSVYSPEIQALYKFKMHGYMNRPDSSAVYLEKMLNDYPSLYLKDVTLRSYFSNILIGLYDEIGEYSKALGVFESIEKSINDSSIPGYESWKKEQLATISQQKKLLRERMKTSPAQVINLSDKKEVSVDIIKKDSMIIPIKCNGVSINSWIDTGAESYLFMQKKTAERCGIKGLSMQKTDTITYNGIRAAGSFNVVDSLMIGSLLFTKIPVVVVNDDYLSLALDSNFPDSIIDKAQNAYNSVYGFSDVVIGLPILKMLGSIEFDWGKNKVNLCMKKNVSLSDEKPNIFVTDKNVYTHLRICGNDYVGFMDSGAQSTCLSLTPSFHNQHRKDIILSEDEKSQRAMGVGIYWLDEKYRLVLNPNVLSDNKVVNLEEGDVLALSEEDTIPQISMRDGIVGMHFLRKLGSKLKFDFVNMRMTAE